MILTDTSGPREECGLALDDVAPGSEKKSGCQRVSDLSRTRLSKPNGHVRGDDHELGIGRGREDGGDNSSEGELHR